MYYGLKQGQITPNIENKYVLKLIHLVAQCSKVTNTALFLKRIFHQFSAFCCLLLVMSECPKVHFVALRFICCLLFVPDCQVSFFPTSAYFLVFKMFLFCWRLIYIFIFLVKLR